MKTLIDKHCLILRSDVVVRRSWDLALPLKFILLFIFFQLKHVLAESERQLSVAQQETQTQREELSQVGFPWSPKHLLKVYTYYSLFTHNYVANRRFSQGKTRELVLLSDSFYFQVRRQLSDVTKQAQGVAENGQPEAEECQVRVRHRKAPCTSLGSIR